MRAPPNVNKCQPKYSVRFISRFSPLPHWSLFFDCLGKNIDRCPNTAIPVLATEWYYIPYIQHTVYCRTLGYSTGNNASTSEFHLRQLVISYLSNQTPHIELLEKAS